MQKIELNDEFVHALKLMDEGRRNVFITGRAGTGKSTLLQYFRENTRKNVVVLAPTGIAAINAGGQTIHSFFNFRPEVTPDTVSEIKPRDTKIYKKIDTVIIDEISMVRADLLDCIDLFLRRYGKKRKRPFGGIQMVFIGDLYQLPPVVKSKEKTVFNTIYKSPYFFDARVMGEIEIEFVELEKVYRQRDDSFIDLLNRIRNNTVTPEDLERLNTRVMPDFEPSRKDFYIYLTTTNALADKINMQRLKDIKGREHIFEGYIEGDFPEKDLPTGLTITLKKGAQVMLLNNDSLGRWINGSIGRIVDFVREGGKDIILVELEDGEVVDVLPFRWETIEYYYDEDRKRLLSSVTGSFTQYPLRLSWAVTIHKSQGKTFDKVIIDLGHGTFAHGQVYVALSRCTSFEGMVLKKPLKKRHILMDWKVVNFLTGFQYSLSEKEMPFEEKVSIIRDAIENQQPIEITYLKRSDEKSKRVIQPVSVGEMYYGDRRFIGLRAFCKMRNDERNFRVDRILKIRKL
jgi:ATP-dependent exoDNAse (exonuclease V) alpha subunit